MKNATKKLNLEKIAFKIESEWAFGYFASFTSEGVTVSYLSEDVLKCDALGNVTFVKEGYEPAVTSFKYAINNPDAVDNPFETYYPIGM